MNEAKRSIIAFLLICLPWPTMAQTPIRSDSEIRQILVERIDAQHQSLGIVVGVIEPAGKRIVTYGVLDQGDTRPLNGDTLFEIGSVTKVFTSLLLADMVERGEVSLTDPVSKFLPPGVSVPERGGRAITLEDLSTHTAGLHRLPTNLSPKNLANSYVDYSAEKLYQFLSNYQLPRDIGSQYEYSNLGAGLLGQALTLRAGKPYELLLRSRILGPLGMNSTRITLSPGLKLRMAAGHNNKLESVPNWDLDALAGAGALRSSANDLLTFLSAELGYTNTPLAPAMARMLTVRHATGNPGLQIALAWHILTPKDNQPEIVWHNGGTSGFRSSVGFDQKRRIGVVVLSNAFTVAGVDDIALHLLDTQLPLATPPQPHTAISIDPAAFDRYTGSYQMAPGIALTVTRNGGHFFVQMTNQPKLEIFPESEHHFFLKAVDAQITFETDGNGRATAVVLHQLGRDLQGAAAR